MRLGVHFVNFTLPGGPAAIAPTLAATARAAEEGGCAWFSVMDHWFQMEDFGSAEEPMLEGYTSLGFVAGQTRTIDLGLLVTGVTYRHPGLLAKQATTLDVLSGGRAILAIGAGWYEREHAGLGVPFPPVPERLERLEETLQICRQMWSDDDGPFEGRHYRLAETICSPQPLQEPRPGSSSAAAASGSSCGSLPGTPTGGTSSGSARRSSATRSRSSTATARRRVAIRRASRRRSSPSATRSPTLTPSSRRWTSTPGSESSTSR